MRVSLDSAARGGLVCDSGCTAACGGTCGLSGEVGLPADYIIIYGIDSDLRGSDAVEATSGFNETLAGIADHREVVCRIIC